MAIKIDVIEVLVLKKLVLINHALSKSLADPMAAREQKSLVSVLNDITLRADLDNKTTAEPQEKADE